MKRLPGAESSVPREDNLPLIPEIKPAPDYSPGALIKGRYRVKERTCGSMGDVYHCQDTLRNSDVALKTVISSGRTEHRKVLSFKSEIDRIFRLPPHPNVLTLQRIEYIDGYYYLVTEWIDGENGSTLRDWFQPDLFKEHLTCADVLGYMQQICCGLAHCYKHLSSPGSPFVFGDLKPENILMGKNGILKLGDFSDGFTPGYCAPELYNEGLNEQHSERLNQGDNEGLNTQHSEGLDQEPNQRQGDERSDLYSMAKVSLDILNCVSDYGSPLYEQLWDVLARCLQENPADRFPSLSALMDVLTGLCSLHNLENYDDQKHAGAPFLDKYNRITSALNMGLAARIYDPLYDHALMNAFFHRGTFMSLSDYKEATSPNERKLYRAKSLFYSGKTEEALAELEGRLATSRLLHFRAFVLYTSGRIEESVHCLLASILKDDHLPSYDLLGTILLDYPVYRSAFRRESESLTGRAAGICKDHPTGYLPFQAAAKLFMLEKDYRTASAYFRRSLQFVNIESEWQTLYYYGSCENAAGRTSNAAEIMDRAAALIESDPDHLKNSYESCVLFFCLNALRRSEKACRLAEYLKAAFGIDYTGLVSQDPPGNPSV